MSGLISSNFLTLFDWAKRLDPEGKTETRIAEVLSQHNDILIDALFSEGNLTTGHRVVMRTALPEAEWRVINRGTQNSKSETTQIEEHFGRMEARSCIDEALMALNNNSAAFRLSEDAAFIEAMNQQQVMTLFYGDQALNPAAFTGFAKRYSSLNGPRASNIINAKGTGANNNASIWLVGWGANTVFCGFPKGSKAGLEREDLGKLQVYDAEGRAFDAYVTKFIWYNGLVVKDWRYVLRIANIDSAKIHDTGAVELMKLMSRALDHIPSLSGVKAAFYMNRTMYSALRLQALDKSNAALSVQDALSQFGTPAKWLTFLGVPVRQVDALRNDETKLV